MVCWDCVLDLETTNNFRFEKNEITDLLVSSYPIHRAASYYNFKKRGVLQEMIHALKYNKNKEIGLWIGRQMAEGLGDWLEHYEVIIPIPIHKRRVAVRGYNQAEVIAMGIGEITTIEVMARAVTKVVHNESQTHKNKLERIKNVKGVYQVSQPAALEGKNILLLDDIVTTGSTVLSCVEEIYNNSSPQSLSVLFVASQEYI